MFLNISVYIVGLSKIKKNINIPGTPPHPNGKLLQDPHAFVLAPSPPGIVPLHVIEY